MFIVLKTDTPMVSFYLCGLVHAIFAKKQGNVLSMKENIAKALAEIIIDLGKLYG